MPERKTQKNFFRLNQGLNTESNEINFPDGFTTDEANYELLPDGSRRRRRGLAIESGGAAKTVATITTTQKHSVYKWRAAGGDTAKNFLVTQVGAFLYFSDDAELTSTTYNATTVALMGFVQDPANVADATVASAPVQFTHGRGHLFVTGKHIRPFYVEYDATADDFLAKDIKLRIRDFDGIDDGIGLDISVVENPIPDDHKYNLRNRGWKQADIDAHYTSKSYYPAKNTIWWRGYKRITNVGFSDLDGVQQFDPDRIDAEFFGNASARQGSLLINPLDSRQSSSTSGGTETSRPAVRIASYTVDSISAGLYTFTITTEVNHGLANGEIVTFSGTRFGLLGYSNQATKSIDGQYVVSAQNGAKTFEITTVPQVPNSTFVDSTNWSAGIELMGQIDGGFVLDKSDGTLLTEGPTSVAYHAGRLFYAGIENTAYSDTIFFSTIAQKPPSYGQCFQQGDPTDFELNELTPADGGTIVVPNLGKVQRMLSVRNVLLVFTDQGVWEVGGGPRGFFTADSYSVRRLTNAECTSPFSPIQTDEGAVFTGPKGIFQIAPNQFTSELEAQNLSVSRIQTLWNQIPTANQQLVSSAYDDTMKRVYLLYGDASTTNTNQYTNCLVVDMRIGAFFKYTFNSSATDGVLAAIGITEADATDDNQKMKFQCQTTATAITTCDMQQSAYLDFDGAETPLPFMVTGWDDLGDFQRRKQAPIITVHAKKTETGYTATGNGLDPVNESSNLMTAYWDWTDNSTPGKHGSQNETYRHVRAYQPVDVNDAFADGYPVVTTRNKVRGRGRVLQLRFDGAATKDSHLLGYSTNYKIQRAA